MDTITGTAAGVPFTALPPPAGTDSPAPLIVTWHMLDAPRTDPAFAAALPMLGVPAWRVHLGMPMCGARLVDGRVDAVVALIAEDAVRSFLVPVVDQAVAEFPAALAALRDRLPVTDDPVRVLGASLGGTVALQVLATRQTPIAAMALVNAGVRVRPAVAMIEASFGQPYRWTPEAEAAVDGLDFLARADEFPTPPPTLVVSGELDHPELRADAAALVDTLRQRSAHPGDVTLTTVPDLAHPLADEPGLGPAPQRPTTTAVDEILTGWFRRQLGAT